MSCILKMVSPRRYLPKFSELYSKVVSADSLKRRGVFVETYEPKYPKATVCLEKNREELLTFFQFPAHCWQSLRTTNPIEFTFGRIRHRTTRTKGYLTRDCMLHMMFKLGQCVKPWRRFRGFRQLAQLIEGVQFHDGLEATELPLIFGYLEC